VSRIIGLSRTFAADIRLGAKDPVAKGNVGIQSFAVGGIRSGKEKEPGVRALEQADWELLAASAEFKRLLLQKKAFLLPAFEFFSVYYFALPVLIGFAPRFMCRRVWGSVTLAYFLALTQFMWEPVRG